MLSDRPIGLDTVTEDDFRIAGRPCETSLPSGARVVILGGGLIGLGCAHYLGAAGLGRGETILLERGELLGEASSGNGGGVWASQMAPGAGAFHDLARASQSLLADFAAGADLDVEYRRQGVLVPARNPEDAEPLREDVRERRDAGLAVDWLDAEEVRRLEPNLDPGRLWGAMRYPDDSHVNPARLGAALARSAQRGGVRIHPGTAVREIVRAGTRALLVTDRGSLEADHVIVAAGPWAAEWADFLEIQVPVVPAKGELLAFAPLPPLLRHAVMSTYGLLQTACGNIISGGTVEFAGWDREPSASSRDRILADARELLPALREASPTHFWARFRPHTPDGLPLVGFCGPDRRHLIAAGHYRNGVLLAAITGRIVADLLTQGSTNFDLTALDPCRFSEPEKTVVQPYGPYGSHCRT